MSPTIDREITLLAMSCVKLNELAEYEQDGILYSRKVVAHGFYDVTVQGPTNRLLLPITCFTAYKQGLNAMSRISADSAIARKGPGRPAKATGPVAPVESPAQAQQTIQPSPAVPQADNWTQVASPWGKPNVTEEPAESGMQWLTNAIAENLGNVASEIALLIKTYEENQPVADASPEVKPDEMPRIKTCGDCFNADIENNSCKAFNNKTPPMKFIINASLNCPQFSEIPF